MALVVLSAYQSLPVLASYQALLSGAGAGSEGVHARYEAFRQRFGRAAAEQPDHVGYETRLRHFEESLAEVTMHNARKGATWVAVLNRFADYTPVERRALLGYRRGASPARAEALPASFLESRQRAASVVDSMDWRSQVHTSADYVHDQGACGSCWAVAAVGALEMHAELRGGGATRPLSYEQLVDCVANPRQCGGTGGCDGATSELAFDYVSRNGLVEADKYTGGYQMGGGSNGFKCPDVSHFGHATIHSSGFKRLATNKVGPLLDFLASTGPAVVSVDAGKWAFFGRGVFTDCPRNATVNHAVLLVGYGHDIERNLDYWLIRNSWGRAWGDGGYIRLQRHQKDVGEAGHCGTDPDNQVGVGCKDDPKEVPVCGMCGVLSDSSYPTDVVVSRGE